MLYDGFLGSFLRAQKNDLCIYIYMEFLEYFNDDLEFRNG